MPLFNTINSKKILPGSDAEPSGIFQEVKRSEKVIKGQETVTKKHLPGLRMWYNFITNVIMKLQKAILKLKLPR